MNEQGSGFGLFDKIGNAFVTVAMLLGLQSFGGCTGCHMPDINIKPSPSPTPKADAVYVVVVEETSQRTPESSMILNDMAFWQGLNARGHSWIFYDKDSKSAIDKGYAAEASKVGLPAVLFLNKTTGKLLDKKKLPSAADIDTRIKELTGK